MFSFFCWLRGNFCFAILNYFIFCRYCGHIQLIILGPTSWNSSDLKEGKCEFGSEAKKKKWVVFEQT